MTFTHITKDGRVLSWTGLGVCACSKCDDLFNSVAAFDKHLVRKSAGGVAKHDTRKMVRNERGHWITAAYTGPSRAP